MTDTLPDLRVTIAEGMEALASQRLPYGSNPEAYVIAERMLYGAETLRWCAERETVSCDQLAIDLAASLEREEEFEEKLVELRRVIEDAAPKIKPAALRDQLLAAMRDV